MSNHTPYEEEIKHHLAHPENLTILDKHLKAWKKYIDNPSWAFEHYIQACREEGLI